MRDLYDVLVWALALLFMLTLGAMFASMSGCASTYSEPLCSPPEVASTQAAIINGEPSTDRRATALVNGCTATVVGPHTVLTAAHCGIIRRVVVEEETFNVVSSEAHPAYSFPTYDVQLLYVVETLPEPYAELGDGAGCVRLVAQGYGIGGGGALHEREVTEYDRSEQLIFGGESICNGDSGGPLYAEDGNGNWTLVGVTSAGLNEDFVCAGGINVFVNLTDPDLRDWIEGRVQ